MRRLLLLLSLFAGALVALAGGPHTGGGGRSPFFASGPRVSGASGASAAAADAGGGDAGAVVADIMNGVIASDLDSGWYAIHTDGGVVAGSSLALVQDGGGGTVTPINLVDGGYYVSTSTTSEPSAHSFSLVGDVKFNDLNPPGGYYILAGTMQAPAHAFGKFQLYYHLGSLFFGVFESVPAYQQKTTQVNNLDAGVWYEIGAAFSKGSGGPDTLYLRVNHVDSTPFSALNPMCPDGGAYQASFAGYDIGGFRSPIISTGWLYTTVFLDAGALDRITGAALPDGGP